MMCSQKGAFWLRAIGLDPEALRGAIPDRGRDKFCVLHTLRGLRTILIAGAAVILLSPSDRVPLPPRRRMRRLRDRCPRRTLGDRASGIGATRSPTRDLLLSMAHSVALSMTWGLLLVPGGPFESKRPLVQ